ncbi:glutaredoxin 2 [Vibrio tubiashii]|uniref:Glutaredoxin n=2 Tax=Vibrio tubiashii TaxID=29498 RepID=F9T9D1_9VIBR|nr:glutaredoxin [Vibrio tubiashii ATCC 19109]EGU51579.1 glutaredoxin 2 [Vibrio tubiashii ATCC 19109]EIF02533.1 glutaredoxin 2 [Vibrio tubiashii NCIMB 1337 = ATCC 19106]
MKLHVFDSCPFCVRVKTVVGLKNIDCEISPMTLGQLPESLAGKLERLTVPVLEQWKHDGEQTVMVESLDIIRYLDQQDEPMFTSYEVSEALSNLLKRLYPVSAQLLYPRMPRLNLPELSTPGALSMFVESRKDALNQSIEQALQKTEEYLPELKRLLEELELLLDIDALVSGERKLNIDDIAAFSELRNYTMVAELEMSERMKSFVCFIASCSGMSLYPPISQ